MTIPCVIPAGSKLTLVVERHGSRVVCRCICGREKEYRKYHVTSGAVKSCGCGRREFCSIGNTKHGMARRSSRPPEYGVWVGIKNRCENRNDPSYPNYGGRGIKVCARWRASFPAFLKDMGHRPSPYHEVDRIDTDGNYEPGNCRWATSKTNNRNRRNNRRITYMGQTLCLAAWSERTGIGRSTIAFRLDRGWTVERALTTRTE